MSRAEPRPAAAANEVHRSPAAAHEASPPGSQRAAQPKARTVLSTARFEDRAPDDHVREPHPITQQHLKNFREVDLLHGAWRAIKQGDYVTGRQLLNAHRAEYPGQWEDMNDGLEAVADCMEDPSAETVARARRFYDEHTASMMRKRIRRFCLEPNEAKFTDASSE